MDTASLEFTCTVTRSLGKAARTLAESDREKAESPKLIDLATRLFNIAEELDQPLPRHKAVSVKRIRQYLTDLEKICTVSSVGKTSYAAWYTKCCPRGHTTGQSSLLQGEV